MLVYTPYTLYPTYRNTIQNITDLRCHLGAHYLADSVADVAVATQILALPTRTNDAPAFSPVQSFTHTAFGFAIFLSSFDMASDVAAHLFQVL